VLRYNSVKNNYSKRNIPEKNTQRLPSKLVIDRILAFSITLGAQNSTQKKQVK
jgi:hypothetical protein